MTVASRPRRTIRSYVRRESRLTPAQRRALEELWPRYGVEAGASLLRFEQIFGRQAPVILEIGFGNGDALIAAATAHPENNYLGIEVHRPGAGGLLRRLEAGELGNVRLMLGDAKDILADRIPDASLSAVQLFFPDPWPKKRHHKRRLVQPEFAALVACKLLPGGYFHLATDWPEYAERMEEVVSATAGLEAADESGAREIAATRRATRFEQRGRALGHAVRDLVYRRRS